MLTPDLLRWRAGPDGAVEPAWLSERDDVWLRELLNAIDGRVGVAVGRLESGLRAELEPTCRAHRVDSRAFAGAVRVALRDFRRTTASEVEPSLLRSAAFADAASVRAETRAFSAADRVAVLDRVATKFGLLAAEVDAALYADHPRLRKLERRNDGPTPAALRDAYQLALLQGFLLRSSEVSLWVRTHVRAVARFAKLSRLLCTFTIEGDATRLALSGPLALFHATLKYGRALATFIPSVVSTPGWQLEASCVLPSERLRLSVGASAPLPRTHALPRDTDSKLEALLARDLRRLRSEWQLLREASAFQVGAQVVFPDFVLVRGDARVVVEIVGFWTPEYLASKLRVLAALSDVPLVVAVDKSHGVLPTDLPAAELVAFDRHVDPVALLAAAERAAARGDGRGTLRA